MNGDLCPSRSPLGRQCERWALPAAHLDGDHQAGTYRWPVDSASEQLDLFDLPEESHA